jgi:hypothetical protein
MACCSYCAEGRPPRSRTEPVEMAGLIIRELQECSMSFVRWNARRRLAVLQGIDIADECRRCRRRRSRSTRGGSHRRSRPLELGQGAGWRAVLVPGNKVLVRSGQVGLARRARSDRPSVPTRTQGLPHACRSARQPPPRGQRLDRGSVWPKRYWDRRRLHAAADGRLPAGLDAQQCEITGFGTRLSAVGPH